MSNPILSVLLRLVISVDVECSVADAQLQGIEGGTADEQVHVLWSQGTLRHTSREGSVSATKFHDNLVDVLLVDFPEGTRDMALDLTFQHDVQHEAGGLDKSVALLHHVVMPGSGHYRIVGGAILVDDVGNLIEKFSLHSSSYRIQTADVLQSLHQ